MFWIKKLLPGTSGCGTAMTAEHIRQDTNAGAMNLITKFSSGIMIPLYRIRYRIQGF
jgi:hypothetical protein